MIQLQNYTPEVYYRHSRDFQFIGRLYDIVLNSVKTNSELLNNLSNGDNFNAQLVDLLTLTLGFKSKHRYNTKQLVALCSVFPTILKNKGNIKAVQLAGQTVLNAEGITEPFSCEMLDKTLYMFVPSKLSDLNLLRDLLEYILPAGITCEFAKGIKFDEVYETEIDIDTNVSVVKQESSATAVLYDDKYQFAGNMTKTTLYDEGSEYNSGDIPVEIKEINEE